MIVHSNDNFCRIAVRQCFCGSGAARLALSCCVGGRETRRRSLSRRATATVNIHTDTFEYFVLLRSIYIFIVFIGCGSFDLIIHLIHSDWFRSALNLYFVAILGVPPPGLLLRHFYYTDFLSYCTYILRFSLLFPSTSICHGGRREYTWYVPPSLYHNTQLNTTHSHQPTLWLFWQWLFGMNVILFYGGPILLSVSEKVKRRFSLFECSERWTGL